MCIRELPCSHRAGKSKKGKSKSAFRGEFDRQSEEEEAAERAAMSTPGFSDNGELLAAPASLCAAGNGITVSVECKRVK